MKTQISKIGYWLIAIVMVASMVFAVVKPDFDKPVKRLQNASRQKDIKITYLSRSGWLLETEKHMLLLDYTPYNGVSFDDFLISELQRCEAENKTLSVFISHEHEDHFYPAILEWPAKFRNLQLVLGWNYSPSKPGLYQLSGRADTSIGAVKVSVHPANDAGSAFLITVDGITIYHAGDHAMWLPELAADYEKEIEYIKSKAPKISIAFLPVENSRKHVMDGAVRTAEILRPEYVFPMHSSFNDYEIFAKEIKTALPSATARNPKAHKDTFCLKKISPGN